MENNLIYAKKSGILPFKKNDNGVLEFLLGLPGEPIEPHKKIPGFYGTWDIFKGHTDGQDVKTAAIREFSEETSLSSNLIRNDNFYDLGFCGTLYTFALDVTDYDIDEKTLHSNEVHSKHGYMPFQEIGEYKWFKLPITVSVRKSAVIAMEKITQIMMKQNMLSENIKEMQAQHISPFDFNQFKLDATTWASGEKSAVSHGFGIYVAIDPYSGGRYVKSAIKDNKDKPQAIFYDVEIPDFDGHNYILMHGAMDKEDYDKINNIFKQTFGVEIDLHETNKAKRGGILNGFNIMDCIEETINNLEKNGSINLGIDKKSFFKGRIPTNYNAAKFLNEKCGYVGGMYMGRSDRMCAFIFDPTLIKINKKINVKDIIQIKPLKYDANNQTEKKQSEKERDVYKNAFNNSKFYQDRLKSYYTKYPNEDAENKETFKPDYMLHKIIKESIISFLKEEII